MLKTNLRLICSLSLTSHNTLAQEVLLPSLSHEAMGSERLSDLPEITQPGRGGRRILFQMSDSEVWTLWGVPCSLSL